MAIVTITGSDVSGGSPSGGGVGGGSNLTTAGAVPYVASAGVLTQAATGLFYDSANVRLGVGTGSPSYAFHAVAISPSFSPSFGSTNGSSIFSAGATSTFSYIGSDSNHAVYFRLAAAEVGRIAATTGNWLIGKASPTDGNYKFDIQASGSSGTLRVYDQTATTGSTSLVVQAGAGQSSKNLQEWRNNAGTVISALGIAGMSLGTTANPALLIMSSSSGQYFYADNSDQRIKTNSSGIFAWANGANASGTVDAGLARASAGVVEINNGRAGTLCDLLLRYLQNTGVTVATLPAAAAGNAGSRAYVTDANATTIGTTVAGGGANKVMVWSDGTNWKIYAS